MRAFIILFIIIGNTVFSQNSFYKTISWLGDNTEAQTSIETATGDIFIAGYYEFSKSGFAMKLNSNGDTIWTKHYYGIGIQSDLCFKSGISTSDGGFIITGYYDTSNFSISQIYVLKIDSIGNIQWQKTLRHPTSHCWGIDIQETSNGEFVLVGKNPYYHFVSKIPSDITVIKLDKNGNKLWDKLIHHNTDDLSANKIIETNDGGYAITGAIIDTTTSQSKIYLIKLDKNGNLLWTKNYYGKNSELGTDIIQEANGNFIIIANRLNGNGQNTDMIFLKTDSLGIQITNTEYSGPIYLANSIKKTKEKNYIIAHTYYSNQDIFPSLLLIDSTGNYLWSKYYSRMANSLSGSIGKYAHQVSDGGYFLISYGQSGAIGDTTYCIKTDSAGNIGCYDSLYALNSNIYQNTTSINSLISLSGVTIANAVFPDGYQTNNINTYCSSVGINETLNDSFILVYPNPSTDIFTFSGLERSNSIEIFDLTGRLIYSRITQNNSETIDLINQSRGMYFYRISNKKEVIQQGKISLN